jgi:hypothetical protein
MPNTPALIEPCVYDLPLQLDAALEPDRPTLRQTLLAAQRRLREFARKHGWEAHVEQPFALQAHIYEAKAGFDHDLLAISDMDTTIELPETYCAALENNILMSVSPELYQRLFPEGEEADSFEKLLTHEMAHRLHIRILKGDEEAMGPVWFYEGFALVAASQFEHRTPNLSPEEIWEVVDAQERGSYIRYASVLRTFLGKADLHRLVEMAGKPDFVDWLRSIL